jgi:hypothetical protein
MTTIIFYFLSGSLLGLTLGKHLKNEEDLSSLLLQNKQLEDRLLSSEKKIETLVKGIERITKESNECLTLTRDLSLLNKYQKHIRIGKN